MGDLRQLELFVRAIDGPGSPCYWREQAHKEGHTTEAPNCSTATSETQPRTLITVARCEAMTAQSVPVTRMSWSLTVLDSVEPPSRVALHVNCPVRFELRELR